MEYVRIGELSRVTGMSESTLRMWERRYGIVEPRRLANGYRAYSPQDVERVLAMRRGLARGLAAAEAAAIAVGTEPDADATPSHAAVAALTELRQAFDRWDGVAGRRVAQRALVTLGLRAAVEEVLFPYLRELGERWATGEVSVAQEHFATQSLRAVLLRLADGWQDAAGPTAVLACAPGEEHDLGLVCLGVALHGYHGWRVVFFGASTPPVDALKAAYELEPAAVVLSAVTPERFREAEPTLARLANRFRVGLGGAGATSRLAGAVGAELLPGGPIHGASLLAAGARMPVAGAV